MGTESVAERKAAYPFARQESPSAEKRQVGSAPNSSYPLSDSSGDKELNAAMQRRMAEHFPGISSLSQGSGKKVELPEELKGSIEAHFAHSVDNLTFRESQDVTQIGAKAYARGDEIHFAPGQFRPDTAEGRKMIGHEISHVAQQRSGQAGPGGVVNLDPAMESRADLHGDAVVSMHATIGAEPTGEFSPMPAVSYAAAPVQGWGIDILGRRNKGQHEQITEAARKKAAAALTQFGAYGPELESADAQKSLRYGARFNDVGHHSALGMAYQMELGKKDAFINQTHHGDMQFLHSMDTSSGDTAANVRKVQRYAKFASDTYQNRADAGGTRMQDTNMLDYVMSQGGEDDPFQEMMMSTMVDPKALKKFDKKFDKKFNGTNDTKEARAQRRRARTEAIKKLVSYSAEDQAETAHAAETKYNNKGFFGRLFAGNKEKYIQKAVAKEGAAREKNKSKYAKGTVGNFFTGGKRGLNAGLVALGSASHMLEDSFAGSHASRSDNLYMDTERDTALSLTGEEIARKATPIMGNNDYNKQDNFVIGGRHGKADVYQQDTGDIDADLRATQGGSLARDAAAQFMMMNVREKQGADGTDAPAYEDLGINRFVEGVTRADDLAVKLDVTATGRGYDKKMKKGIGDKRAQQGVESYWEMTGRNIVGNKHTTAGDRIEQMRGESGALSEIMAGGSEAAKQKYSAHAKEMLVNVCSMIRQIENSENPDQRQLASLKAQRTQLMDMLELTEGDMRLPG